jgi:hypothetical protein
MKILLADDNQLVRRGIAEILAQEEDWVLCGEASRLRTESESSSSGTPFRHYSRSLDNMPRRSSVCRKSDSGVRSETSCQSWPSNTVATGPLTGLIS